MLVGGAVNEVVRIGDTVRRPVGPHTPYVHALLRFLEVRGWGEGPRVLGVDAQGREVLSFVPGSTGEVLVGLVRVAEMTREFHDLTAGTPLAGDREVVCHNDLAPRNTVFRSGLPVAFIDWDLARPGARLQDVGHVCWQFVGLGPQVVDVRGAAANVRLVCDAYGLVERRRLVDAILWWQDRCWRGIDALATAGQPAMVRLREQGAVGEVRASFIWTRTHRDVFDAALR